MPAKAVADAVEARLIANWTATVIVPYDTIGETPDVEAFLIVQYPVVNGVQPVLERKFFEEGAFRIVLNVARGIGLEQGLTWCDTLKDIFRRVKFSGVETFVPSGPVTDDNTDQGNWISYSIIVPYRYEFDSAVFEFAST